MRGSFKKETQVDQSLIIVRVYMLFTELLRLMGVAETIELKLQTLPGLVSNFSELWKQVPKDREYMERLYAETKLVASLGMEVSVFKTKVWNIFDLLQRFKSSVHEPEAKVNVADEKEKIGEASNTMFDKNLSSLT